MNEFDKFPEFMEKHNRPYNQVYRLKENVDSINAEHCEIPRPEYNYQYNSDGLRTIEFSEKPNVITMGCSNTFGLGLPIDKIWPSFLEKKLKEIGNYTVGNISYNGSSPMTNISNFFAFIKKYKYAPEYLICNFSNFERLSFFAYEKYDSPIVLFFHKERLFKDEYPYNWEKTILLEEYYYKNLDYIRMLEVFCEYTGIKLIWSTWSNVIKNDYESYLNKNFKYYRSDYTRDLFPSFFEFGSQDLNEYNPLNPTVESLTNVYRMKNWNIEKCHIDIFNENFEIFDFAYDIYQNKTSYIKGDIVPCHPHPGTHRQIHWAEFYFNEMVNYEHNRI